jgi:CBS-domain-containing membrane protein
MIRIKDLKVRDAMDAAATIQRKAPVKDALAMLKASPGIMAVVDDKGRIMGTVSERSFIKLVKHQTNFPMSDAIWFDTLDEGRLSLPVESIMNARITTVKPTDDALTALKLMNTTRARFLHVADGDGKVLGIVRVATIIRKLRVGADK